MSRSEPVRRRRLAPQSSSDAGPGDDWRRFVLDEVGYDEAAREQTARRMEIRRGLRRFLGGVLFGLAVFAVAFAMVFAVREGRLDRYLPKKAETSTPLPPSARWARTSLPEATEDHDTHVILKDPLAPPPRAPVPSTDPDDDGPSPRDTAPASDSN